MKRKYLYFFGFLLCCQLGWGQLVHIHYNNNDSPTRAKLGILIGTATARNVSHGAANAALGRAIASHTTQLLLQYTKNFFDRKNSFLTSAVSSTALSLGTSVMSSYPKLPYMTRQKKDYIQETTMSKAVLASLQVLPHSKIKSGKRQEIYRFRRALVKALSKHDREARALLLFSAAGLLATDPEMAMELFGVLKVASVL